MQSKWILALKDRVHPSWHSFLQPLVVQLLVDIEEATRCAGVPLTPAAEHVLRFLSTDLSSTKVLVMGQDPYPQEGVATGRAFEVAGLTSWHETFRNTSLKNIVRALYAAKFHKFKRYKQIAEDGFSWLLPPDALFAHWEDQGVLLLNTSFTCEVGASNSHEKLWREFSMRLFRYIADQNNQIVWFLWGNHAQQMVRSLPIQYRYETMHPMLCAQKENRPTDFLFGRVNVFAETAHLVDWYGVGFLH
jgi:uracil-DNA glycosylase